MMSPAEKHKIEDVRQCVFSEEVAGGGGHREGLSICGANGPGSWEGGLLIRKSRKGMAIVTPKKWMDE
ncbi:hypothetical protein GWI33_007740 [Rhynchophorus ferrugineus]|uniref:Uncharacterized protein n=1 Tax=Rhynchophorus ferrugineus TaxID=354439 RepID=A0A834MK35_RHYFE|nr:hypothetical protein GWI33_007740 [Rhynchophorus ferrugineus]